MTFTSSASAFAALALMCSCTPDASVRILRLTGRAGPAQAAAVFMNTGAGCRDSRVQRFTGGGTLEIDPAALAGCWACGADMAAKPPKLAVFSRGNAPALLEGKDLCDRIQGSELAIPLPPREPLSFDAWVPTAGSEQATAERIRQVRDEFANADWLLDSNMTGVSVSPRIQAVEPSAIPEDCTFVPRPNQPARSGLAFTPDRLNVYFSGPSNVNCGGRQALYVQSGGALGDLAHEIGHRLGLRQLDAVDGFYEQGHTNNIPGFDCSNTMWTHSGIPDEQLTIGQAFWIGLSCESPAGRKRAGCVECTPGRGGPPCVPFGLALPGAARGACEPCTKQRSASIRSSNAAARLLPENLVSETFQLCTLGEVNDKITARYDALSGHTAGLPDLRVADKAEFIGRWAKAGLAVLAIDLASRETEPAKRKAWIDYLEGQLKAEPNSYLSYNLNEIRNGRKVYRCGVRGVYEQ